MTNGIGQRLREYRIRNRMTQQAVAEAIGISAQAVSKWETGTALPDISVLVPLAALFRVTTDEILGNTARRDYWESKWREVCAEPGGALEVSEKALSEMPDDKIFLYRRACSEYLCADSASVPDGRTRLLNSSALHFSDLYAAYPDFEDALSMLVRVLSASGRTEEARRYAERSPDRDRLLTLCLSGAELSAQNRLMIGRALSQLTADLLNAGSSDMLRLADVLIDNGAGLYDGRDRHAYRLAAICRRAMNAAEEKKCAEAVDALREAFDYLRNICGERFSADEAARQFQSFLQSEKLSVLKERADYKALVRDFEAFLKTE